MSPFPFQNGGCHLFPFPFSVSLELDIPTEPLGSTTFRRKDRRKGLEPRTVANRRYAAGHLGGEGHRSWCRRLQSPGSHRRREPVILLGSAAARNPHHFLVHVPFVADRRDNGGNDRALLVNGPADR